MCDLRKHKSSKCGIVFRALCLSSLHTQHSAVLLTIYTGIRSEAEELWSADQYAAQAICG